MKMAQVGTLDTMELRAAQQAISDSSTWPTFLPKQRSSSRSSLRLRGMEVRAAAMPKEARMKKTMGWLKPVRALPKLGVMPRTGISAQLPRQINSTGSASVTSKIRNAASIPNVRMPSWVRPPMGGRSIPTTSAATAPAMPKICFLFILSASFPALSFRNHSFRGVPMVGHARIESKGILRLPAFTSKLTNWCL